MATGVEYSIGDLTNMLIAELNPEAKIITDEQRMRPEASEVYRLLGDNTKISTLTSWRPAYDLLAGLKDTIEWFKQPENLQRYKAWLYNV